MVAYISILDFNDIHSIWEQWGLTADTYLIVWEGDLSETEKMIFEKNYHYT